jgi:hypothetical protein
MRKQRAMIGKKSFTWKCEIVGQFSILIYNFDIIYFIDYIGFLWVKLVKWRDCMVYELFLAPSFLSQHHHDMTHDFSLQFGLFIWLRLLIIIIISSSSIIIILR